MANAFEEARHHGFSEADMAPEMEEMERRIESLGCDTCWHRNENSPVCETIINHSGEFFSCMFYCERKEERS